MWFIYPLYINKKKQWKFTGYLVMNTKIIFIFHVQRTWMICEYEHLSSNFVADNNSKKLYSHIWVAVQNGWCLFEDCMKWNFCKMWYLNELDVGFNIKFCNCMLLLVASLNILLYTDHIVLIWYSRIWINIMISIFFFLCIRF